MAIYYYLRSGIGVYFADGPSQVGSYLAELKPSVLTVVPRILEKLAEKLSEAPSRTIGPKKWLLQWAIRVARTSNPEVFSWRRALLEPLVYRKMRAALGDNFRTAQKRAYELADGITFDGRQYRRDIGHRALGRKG